MEEIHRVLRDDGFFVLIESIPPDEESMKYWKEILELKDMGRHKSFYLTKAQLEEFIACKFNIVSARILKQRIFLKQWLDNCVRSIDRDRKRYIYQKIISLPTFIKERYEFSGSDIDDMTFSRIAYVLIAKKK